MSKQSRFQGRLTLKDKESIGMKDQEFLEMCIELNKSKLLKPMYRKLIKAKKDAAKSLSVKNG